MATAELLAIEDAIKETKEVKVTLLELSETFGWVLATLDQSLESAEPFPVIHQ